MADDIISTLIASDEAREVAGFPDYVVTRCGKVFSRNHSTGPLRYFRQLRGGRDKKGYIGLTLCNEKGHFPRRIHRLVAEAFVPNPKNLPCVRHLNGVAGDNRAANLAWGTYAQNEADKLLHGTWDSRRTGKLNNDTIAQARRWHSDGISQREIAQRLDVSRPTITRLLNGNTWGNVPCAY